MVFCEKGSGNGVGGYIERLPMKKLGFGCKVFTERVPFLFRILVNLVFLPSKQ